MLTRLRVSGFKNLVDVDVHFGPFTCIAGVNGVGKSNLFDAISFLSALADRPLIDAAMSVRDEAGRTTEVRSLFHRIGDTFSPEMSFDAEMIVPETGHDDLGQAAQASITFLRYSLALKYRAGDARTSRGSLEIVREELVHITLGDAKKHLRFPHSAEWRKSAIKGARRGGPFISTQDGGVMLHQDRSGGRPLSRSASTLPRTVLSAANAAESPTALLARREMQSWRLLQLEPSSLRRPDDFSAVTRLGADGSHLPACLNHLAKTAAVGRGGTAAEAESSVYGQIAGRLSELIADVTAVGVDRDERRELLTVQVTGADGTAHPARALSDGTLRFLALAVLEMDPSAQGLLCLEEPENGIHPERIPAMLTLLQDISTDVDAPLGADNPLRQVIINTHSPAVVQEVPDDTLLVAQPEQVMQAGERFRGVVFAHLADTWRDDVPEEPAGRVVSKGRLLAFLNPVPKSSADDENIGDSATDRRGNGHVTRPRTRRVADRPDLQTYLPFVNAPE
jgi:predicted ATPase